MDSGTNPIVDISDDFIAVIDNSCPDQLCDELVECFEIYSKKDGFIYDRLGEGSGKLAKEDLSLSITGKNLLSEINIRQMGYEFCAHFWPNCYAPYAKKFAVMDMLQAHKVLDMKLQKTLPGQGYHIWHVETTTRELSNRLLTFALYLNDVEDGGETEFLYQKRRVKPKKGRCVVWPAGITHVHRGNPPLSGEKYILTGWVTY